MNMIPWWNIFHVDVNLSIAEFFWLAQLFGLFLIGFFLHEPKLWDFQFSHLFLSQSFWQFDFVFYWNILITRGPIAPDVLHSILHALQKLITHLNGLWAKNNIVNWRRDQYSNCFVAPRKCLRNLVIANIGIPDAPYIQGFWIRHSFCPFIEEDCVEKTGRLCGGCSSPSTSDRYLVKRHTPFARGTDSNGISILRGLLHDVSNGL